MLSERNWSWKKNRYTYNQNSLINLKYIDCKSSLLTENYVTRRNIFIFDLNLITFFRAHHCYTNWKYGLCSCSRSLYGPSQCSSDHHQSCLSTFLVLQTNRCSSRSGNQSKIFKLYLPKFLPYLHNKN